MNRQEKQVVIDSIKRELKDNESTFVVGVKGMTVESIQSLRKNLREKGGKLKVAKNTLLRLAIKDFPSMEELTPHFKNQIALIFGKEDVPGVAKLIFNFSKENENFDVIAGAMHERVIDKAQITLLATLPSQEVLQVQLCSVLKSPIFRFVFCLNQLRFRLVAVLKQISSKKEDQ